MLTLQEVAELAKVQLKTVRRWVKPGILNNRMHRIRLHTKKIGATRKTTKRAYRAFVQKMSVEAEL